jgi:crossover junction endonuclease EME1
MDTREWNPPTPNVIKFVRKVNAEWDEEGGFFRPCDEYRRDEDWIIHWLKADKFVELTSSDHTGLALKFHIERLKNVVPGAKVVLVLEGLTAVLTRAANALKNVLVGRSRAMMPGNQSQNRPRNDVIPEGLNVAAVEDALVELQLLHEIRIVQTSSAPDSAEWISILATDISSIPYKYVLLRLI